MSNQGGKIINVTDAVDNVKNKNFLTRCQNTQTYTTYQNKNLYVLVAYLEVFLLLSVYFLLSRQAQITVAHGDKKEYAKKLDITHPKMFIVIMLVHHLPTFPFI